MRKGFSPKNYQSLVKKVKYYAICKSVYSLCLVY
jgi:hypothetical protein